MYLKTSVSCHTMMFINETTCIYIVNCLGNFMKFINKDLCGWGKLVVLNIFYQILKISIFLKNKQPSVLHTARVPLRRSLPILKFSVLQDGLVVTQGLATVIGRLTLMLEKTLKLLLSTLIWMMILSVIMTN